MRLVFLLVLAMTLLSCKEPVKTKEPVKILVFSKTAGYRHPSIADGVRCLFELAKEQGIHMDTTENASVFSSDGLFKYRAIVFLSPSGNILDSAEEIGFKNYIVRGGNFMGIHGASTCENAWPWYNTLIGAYFDNHPAVTKARFTVMDAKHPATSGLPATFGLEDEIYNFKSMQPEHMHVVLTVDETSYEGGHHGAHHPISWYQNLSGGGRSFYTSLGHTSQQYENPIFISHLLGGLRYVLGYEQVK